MKLRSTQLPTREEWLPKHYGPSRIVAWKGKEYVLHAGTQDQTEFWRVVGKSYQLFVLTTNYRLGYMGLDLLDASHDHEHEDAPEYQKACEEVFFQSPDDTWTGIEKTGVPLSDMYAPNAIRVMAEYLG